jgi:hypothetical protein
MNVIDDLICGSSINDTINAAAVHTCVSMHSPFDRSLSAEAANSLAADIGPSTLKFQLAHELLSHFKIQGILRIISEYAAPLIDIANPFRSPTGSHAASMNCPRVSDLPPLDSPTSICLYSRIAVYQWRKIPAGRPDLTIST